MASVLAWFGDGVEREPIADGLLSRPRLIWVDVVRFDLRFLGKPPGFFIFDFGLDLLGRGITYDTYLDLPLCLRTYNRG